MGKIIVLGKNWTGTTPDKDKRPAILMCAPTADKTYTETRAKLNSEFTKEMMDTITNHVKEVFQGYKICDKEHPDQYLQCFLTPNKGFYYKVEYERYLAVVFSCAENFRTYFSLLDTETQKAWEYLFLHGYATPEKLEKASGRVWFKKSTSYSYYDSGIKGTHHASCLMLTGSQGYYTSCQRFVYLREFFWDMYRQYMLPEKYREQLTTEGMETLPAEDSAGSPVSWHTYTNESGVGDQIQVIGQLLRQKAIDFGEKKMTATEVKKVNKQISVPEFFPDTKDNKQKLLAASLCIPILSYLFSGYKESLVEYHNAMRKIFLRYSMRYVLFDMLSHLSGLKRNDVLEETYYDEHEKKLQHALKTLKTGRWYSVYEVQKRMYTAPDVHRSEMVIFPLSITRNQNIYTSDNEKLSPADFYEQVQCPVTYGYLALYAACGLVEVAYTEFDAQTQGVYYGIGAYSFIRYVRLTELGAYILGVTKDYQPGGMHMPTEYFEADPERLIILCKQIDGKNPYEGILTNLAERISGNRYHVTPQTFLRGCSSATDIILKKDYFKENVCPEPSPLWEGFFMEMLNRCNPLKTPKERYSVRQIDATNKELLQIFTTDSYIRQHTLRAENHIILIEQGYVNKIEDKLRTYGYLV